MNQVIRKCNKCHHSDDTDNFSYLGDGVHACPMCGHKRTHIDKVVGTTRRLWK